MDRNRLALVFVFATLSACGGGGGGGGPVIIDPGPTPEIPSIDTERVFTELSFTQPVAMLQAPGDSSRWFVVEKAGFIRVFSNDPTTNTMQTFLDISGIVNASGEGGLLGVAFDPDFPLVPEIYVSYTRDGSPLTSYVSRFSSLDSGLSVSNLTEDVLLSVPQPDTNHNGGDIAFGPDGLLYAAFGDGGGSGDPWENGQDTTNIHGTIVRLDIDLGTPYVIPGGNPFQGNVECFQGVGSADCPEIFAWGLRNPWRFSFDSSTGQLWAGDVGQGEWEEVNIVAVGGNYGWNDREGPACFDPATGCADGFSDPITWYDHSNGDRSVTGGYVARNTTVPDLNGWYVFGDFVSGRIFGIPADSAPGVVPDLLDESELSIVGFAQGEDGELYVVHYGGTLHIVINAP